MPREYWSLSHPSMPQILSMKSKVSGHRDRNARNLAHIVVSRASTVSAVPGDPAPRWSRSDLRVPLAAVVAMSSLVITAAAALAASCNVHEMGHALVATLLGWEVERVNLCLPGGGSVEYSQIGTWAGNAQGYAGGLAAAAFLLVVYWWVFARRALPLRGPGWWGAGLGVVVWVGPQLLLGLLEGGAGPGEDYTEVIGSNPGLFLSLIGVTAVAGGAVYVRRWRVV